MKRLISLLCAILVIFSLSVTAFAASAPSEQDLKDIKSKIEYPTSKEYLPEYVYATVVAPKGHSVFGYGSADRAGTRYQVLNGEEVKVLAERGDMSCCIVTSENAARWIHTKYLLGAGDVHPAVENPWEASDKPSDADLKTIKSKIEYPKTKEYLSQYVYAIVEAPKGHSVYGYGSADRSGTKYQVPDGEEVVVLAERSGMSCCIVISQNAARWINSEYLK